MTFIGLVLERRALPAPRPRRAPPRSQHPQRGRRRARRERLRPRLAPRPAAATSATPIEAVIEVRAARRGRDACEQVTALLETRPIDEVFVSAAARRPPGAHPRRRQPLRGAGRHHPRAVEPGRPRSLARAQLDEIDGRPVITIFSGPPDSLLLAVKRMIDVTVSGRRRCFCSAPIGLLLALGDQARLARPGALRAGARRPRRPPLPRSTSSAPWCPTPSSARRRSSI